ncbi:MAG TPA: DUF2306 domain-containing protein [Steroidobacteraceae bacterium]|nr:DUF2306 domain-containing protein [Steroidobacteraceae bacterium]
MAAGNIAFARRQFPWRLSVVLVVMTGLVLWFIVHRALRFASFDAATYTDYYWPRRFGLVPHIAGGIVAILVGLAQLWLGLTGRTGILHRTLGRIYLGAVAVASTGAFYLAVTIGSEYFAYASGLFGLASAWVITTSMAYVSIRHRAVEQHREWMIRSYVVAFAFVTFRLLDKPLIAWNVAKDTEVWSMMAFACWAVPLLVTEPLLQFRKILRRN